MSLEIRLIRVKCGYFSTEYGVALMKGKSVPERAKALIGLAHPKFRDWLTEEAKKLHYL